jgi:hypothetical protein
MSDEISEPSTNVFADQALEIVSGGPVIFGASAERHYISAIAAALEEAEMRGKESEAAMWELAKLGQEIDRDDLCHATDVASGETVSAEGPLQAGSIREALKAERDRISELTAEKLDLQKIKIYLSRAGWTMEPYGEYGVGWINGPSYGVMPTTPKVGDFRIRMRQLIETIAYHEQRPIHAVLIAMDTTEAEISESQIEEPTTEATPSAPRSDKPA